MAVGLTWLIIQKYRTPTLTHSIKGSIDEIHVKYGDVKQVALSRPGFSPREVR